MIKELYSSYNGQAVDIARIIRSKDIELDINAVLDDEIAGEISKTDTGFKIRVNAKDSPDWKRFTMAHELGHYVFHRHLIGNGVDDNRLYFSTKKGNHPKNSKVTPVHETQAHVFACNVLIPRKELHDYIGKYIENEGSTMIKPEDHFQVPLGVIKWWLDLPTDLQALAHEPS